MWIQLIQMVMVSLIGHQKHRQQKRKYIRCPLSKVKLLCFKGHYQKVKRPLANHTSHKRLVFRIKNTTEQETK